MEKNTIRARIKSLINEACEDQKHADEIKTAIQNDADREGLTVFVQAFTKSEFGTTNLSELSIANLARVQNHLDTLMATTGSEIIPFRRRQ